MRGLSFLGFWLLIVLTSLGQSDFSFLQYRHVGPIRGGRVTAVTGIANEPSTFYMGASGGGLWKSTDYGTSWTNMSDGFFKTPSIGAIAVAQNDPNIVYVGTGSDGIRSNVIIGKGVYKSIDAGQSWKHIGLENAGQIGRILLDPDNHNIAYVAAIGNPFHSNSERGLFKTEDGGYTWRNVLFISDQIGISDVEFLPGNPEILFASAWKVDRKPWSIISGGPAAESGIFKSMNGGETWAKISNGLPETLIGKIDIELCPADSKVVYALIEAPETQGGLYKSIDQGENFVQVSNEAGIRTRPFYYTNLKVDPTNAEHLYVMSTGYFTSVDGGKNWSRLRPPHGDNHDMWINPNNPNLFIQSNDGGANVTHNGGKTWSTQFNQPTAELYQVEVDDQFPYWLYAGQQDNYTTIAVPSMAPSALQDGNVGWIINTGGCETGPAVPKPGDHNIVYANCKGRFSVFDKRTGLERNYDVGAADMYGNNPKDLKFRFQRVSPIHVSPHDSKVIYHTSQYVHKTIDEGKTWEIISPDLTAFEPDKQVISGTPITRDITGEEFYSTIYAIRESPIDPGQIWVGANDGPVHMTRDGGKNWSNVTPSKLLPGGRVDAVEPSMHDPAKAYFTVLRYQLGDDRPYIYKTLDYGKKWELLTDGTNGISSDYPVRVVREDPNRVGLLYAGTDYGLFISFNDGKTWEAFQQNLPITPVTDIKVYRNDLVISTMGRGFWILDNITALHKQGFGTKQTALFKPKDTYRMEQPMTGGDLYPSPTMMFDYYIADTASVSVKLEIKNAAGRTVNLFTSDKFDKAEIIENMNLSSTTFLVDESLSGSLGFHRFHWDMRNFGAWNSRQNRSYKNGPRVSSGSYTASLTVAGEVYSQPFELMTDPRITTAGISEIDIQKKEALALEIVDLLSAARKYVVELEKEKKDAMEDRIKEIDQLLSDFVMEQGIYMQPKLIDQVEYLYNVANGPDQLPGRDAYERFAELKKILQEYY
jgi:photosystem II stability/assembly factor-like uncharacterized protein